MPGDYSQTIKTYLGGYAPSLVSQVEGLLVSGKLGEVLLRKYPQAHDIRSSAALYDLAMSFKARYLRQSPPLSKVIYDDKIHVINHALGLHSYVSRVQGNKLKAKNEIRISAMFRRVPLDFLNMILVHELAHLKEKEHNRAFYKLCEYMQPDYHQLEFDMRMYLTYREAMGELY
ncbi:MAG: M48 family metallopeptidase [Hahellaceae bacterium]|nr:M48 family metallopeptidase [Hahellaceae bacterium]MCP5169956.1 M48 family metallopeptidase [Hahellaceae bacterium]